MFSVAIDGPSGAGKSSVAKKAAALFGFVYVDTGAIYRTIGLAAYRKGIDTKDSVSVIAMLPELQIDMRYNENNEQRMVLLGEDVSGLIRTPEISMCASNVSAIPEVRAYLMDMQRDMAKKHDVIMDGRDIGTVILPDAELKIFLTASAQARAERRCKELREKGIEAKLEDVLADMKKRDEQDSSRAAAPLIAAEDAVYLDTSDMSLNESVNAVCRLISEKTGKLPKA